MEEPVDGAAEPIKCGRIEQIAPNGAHRRIERTVAAHQCGHLMTPLPEGSDERATNETGATGHGVPHALFHHVGRSVRRRADWRDGELGYPVDILHHYSPADPSLPDAFFCVEGDLFTQPPTSDVPYQPRRDAQFVERLDCLILGY